MVIDAMDPYAPTPALQVAVEPRSQVIAVRVAVGTVQVTFYVGPRTPGCVSTVNW